MAWRCNLKPGTCSCWLLRLWNGTGSQLMLQAFMAVFWHLMLVWMVPACSTELDREMNEFTGKFSDILGFY